MKTFKTLFTLLLIIASIALTENVYSQSQPVLYFCEEYTDAGEQNVSDVFTTGWLTVMVKADDPIGYSKVNIEINRYDSYSDSFVYEKSVPFDISSTMKYIYFTDKDNLKFTSPGFYRVQLTGGGRTIASAILRVTRR
jgi:hypothetical protein